MALLLVLRQLLSVYLLLSFSSSFFLLAFESLSCSFIVPKTTKIISSSFRIFMKLHVSLSFQSQQKWVSCSFWDDPSKTGIILEVEEAHPGRNKSVPRFFRSLEVMCSLTPKLRKIRDSHLTTATLQSDAMTGQCCDDAPRSNCIKRNQLAGNSFDEN